MISSETLKDIKGMAKFFEEMVNAIRSGNSIHEVNINSAIIITHLSDILYSGCNGKS